MLPTLNIAAIGKTGEGKSATLNTLLKACHETAEGFVEGSGAGSVTKSIASRLTTFNSATEIRLIDTVGLFDTEWTEDNEYHQGKSMLQAPDLQPEHKQTLVELSKVLALCNEGIHAFLLMVNGTTRFTLETKETIRIILRYFGTEMLDYVIFVVTKADQAEGENLDTMKEAISYFLMAAEYPCIGNRIIFWDNRNRPEEQVNTLLTIIQENLNARDKKPYTNVAFQQAQDKLIKDAEELRTQFNQELDGKIKQETEKVSEKYEAQVADLESVNQEKQKALELEQERHKKEQDEKQKKLEQAEEDMTQERKVAAEQKERLERERQEYQRQLEAQAEAEARRLAIIAEQQRQQELYEEEQRKKDEERRTAIEEEQRAEQARLAQVQADMEAQAKAKEAEVKALQQAVANRPPVIIYRDRGGCFTGEMIVKTPTGKKSIAELEVGDNVLTMDSHGSLVFTELYAQVHNEIHAKSIVDYVEVKLESGEHLILSADHLLFICSENSDITAVQAKNVKVGQQVVTADNGKTASKVTSTLTVAVNNEYCPVTVAGTMLVNRVLCSCYAYEDAFIGHHAIHVAYAPLRLMYACNKLVPFSDKKKSVLWNARGSFHWYDCVLCTLYAPRLLGIWYKSIQGKLGM